MSHIAGRVLVTGGARGIGRAIAGSLIETGAEVVVFDQVTPKELDCNFIQVNLADPIATEEALKNALSSGEINRLVNNVGIVKPALLEDSSISDFESVMNVNVQAAILCTKALLPGMRATQFGRIVNIASRTILGKPLRTNYSASKGSLVSLTRTWALEFAKDHITANTVCPGPIATELYLNANPPESPRTKASLANIPLGRIGKPEDIANAVLFFLDKNSDLITGQTLHICRGSSVGRVDF